MTRHDGGPSVWSELAVIALLGGGLGLAVVASGATLLQTLGSMGFGATMLAAAWLWQWTLQRRGRALSRVQRWIGVAVFVAWLAALGALACWYIAERPV
jgi:hypothetical protein